MLTDRLYIDGLDAFTNFGLLILSGGYNELLAYPPLKPVAYNDWQEEDGIEPDLSNPKLDTKTFSIRFGTLRHTIPTRHTPRATRRRSLPLLLL